MWLEPELHHTFVCWLDEEEIWHPDAASAGRGHDGGGVGTMRDQFLAFDDHPLAGKLT